MKYFIWKFISVELKKKSNLSKRFVNVLSDVACILFMNLIVGYENTCIKKKVSEGPPPQWRHCTLCNEPFYLLCSYHDNTTTSSKSDTPHCTPGVGVPISSTSRVFLLPMSPLLLTIVEIFAMPKSAWFPNYRRYRSQILKNTILKFLGFCRNFTSISFKFSEKWSVTERHGRVGSF